MSSNNIPILGTEEPPTKKMKKSKSVTRERKKSETEKIVEVSLTSLKSTFIIITYLQNSDGSIETHVHLSPHTPAGDPPEPDELIKAIQDLEINIASSDEVVRERIAKLPREVSEVSLLSKIEGKEQFY